MQAQEEPDNAQERMQTQHQRLHWLNGLPHDGAVAAFAQCCASPTWATAMAAARPFPDVGAMLAHADTMWAGAGEAAWRAAFDGHPRIGESKAAVPSTETQQRWSEGEQATVAGADAETRRQLTNAQAEYEQRFGHIFLICATGMRADEMLEQLRGRMRNDPATELRAAAEEQRRITQLRLEKLLTP